MIDDQLADFLATGAAVIVGTRDAALRPEVTRAWGPELSDDRRTLEVLVGPDVSPRTLENVGDNGAVAVTLASPESYRSVQLKGRGQLAGDAGAEALERAERHWRAFAREVEPEGLPPHLARRLLPRRLVAIRIELREVFDQTPGPEAGRRLA